VRVGVLALQGGFGAHLAALEAVGVAGVEIRDADALAAVDGLILPGGESTTMLRLIDRFSLGLPLAAFVAAGKPVVATCAGLILAARRVCQPTQPSFGWLDVTVARNAWGRQLDSFQAVADDGLTPLVFIRAPRILEVGPGAQVLATLHGEPILVRQRNVTAATFHPELTSDRRLHREIFATAFVQAA
jgi:5'-phosphate synthase pdxT subunit